MLWVAQVLGAAPGATSAFVVAGAIPLTGRARFHRLGSPARRAARGVASVRTLAPAFFLSLILGLAAPLASEAMTGLEALEDPFHASRAGVRARHGRPDEFAPQRAHQVRTAPRRLSCRACHQGSRQAPASRHMRKVPPPAPESSAPPDH